MTYHARAVDSFLERWAASGAAERANYQLFLSELCTLLEVPPPEPSRPDDAENAYVFERNVHFTEDDGSTSIGRIDLYKRGAFVLEAKQGSDAQAADAAAAAALLPEKAKKPARRGAAVRGTRSWDDAMLRARGQADRYARALPVTEGWPPFLVVVDVGHSIELYSEFSRSGKTYVPFPDPKSFRIMLADLCRPEIRERLRQVWLDPLALDPSRRSAKVTRELAQRLAELARLLEKAGHHAEDVARFLMRCLFTMFAEDIELIPRGAFQNLLGGLMDEPENFKPAVEDLWRTMNTGGFSPVLRKRLLRFNGGLFAEGFALPLTRPMLQLLHEAAGADWTDVEPAIFGTLLERALDPVERHKLGAHYTPRAYVERLVLPTVIEPLREDWQVAFAAAVAAARQGDLAAARATVRTFHEHLCKTRVLDPACGSGNFLYVTLEQMKRLEGEVLNALRDFGDTQHTLFEVDPHQFLGIEVNPRAAAIADLVLWIGYLQWHFRTRGHAAPAEPIIKNYKNIECRDAVLAWDRKELVLDEQLKPVTRWDGRTMKTHPVTGDEVPDETARVNVERYINPRKAEWPEADFVVGNPPFVGDKVMKAALGEGYVEALRSTYADMPSSCDLVIYWWVKAAELVQARALTRFGFIATNSLRQNFNRNAIKRFFRADPPLCLHFAIPDHPWVDSADGADVRISMTVGSLLKKPGRLLQVVSEDYDESTPTVAFDERLGMIHEDLTIGADTVAARPLKSNDGLSCPGVKLFGQGFVIEGDVAAEFQRRAHGFRPPIIRPYVTAREIAQNPKGRMVIDLLGHDVQTVRRDLPQIWQWLLEHVKPERDQNNRESYRRNWWIFGEPRKTFRLALNGLARQIVTPETAKHRYFVFLECEVTAEGTCIIIADDDAFVMGVLSSRAHEVWALATGSRMGVGNDPRYNKTRCFDPFAFPVSSEAQVSRIRDLAEQLDAHRKRQQALHPKLTLTDMYNVLEKLRAGEELTAKDKTIHQQGLVSVLRQIHDDLDAAVCAAYGWPATLSDDEILERLVALNAQRAAEEAGGLIRWLRPEFQNPSAAKQQSLDLLEDESRTPHGPRGGRRTPHAPREDDPTRSAGSTAGQKHTWPKGRAAQAKAVLAALRDCPAPVAGEELAQRFSRAPRETVDELLQALVALGQARRTRGGKYTC